MINGLGWAVQFGGSADGGFPLPHEGMDVAEFVRALRAVKVWAADPSLETLRRRTGVATSTLSDAFNPQRRRLPPLELVRVILRACGASGAQTARWEQAWRSVRESAVAVPAPRREPGDWTPRQLPPDIAGFAGRAEALAALAGVRSDAPATVVTGTAGVGKTALAVHWAHRMAEEFPDGQLYLDLRGHAEDPTLSAHEALSVLLQSIGVPGERIPVELNLQIGLYRSVLADRRVLVVLDNAIDAAHVRPLLPGSPKTHVLVTSRDALTGLVVRDGAARIALDTLPVAESAELLRAHLGADRVAAEPRAAAELAELCAHLPLALRIAAANLAARPAQTLAGMVGELSGTDLLGQLRVVGDPESAVEAAFDLSYRGLTPVGRRLFRMLGMVPGPEASRPVAAVLLDRPSTAAVPELDELLAAHLISEYRPGRYRMHDLLALFARRRAQRDDSPETRGAALHRLYSWYLLSVDAATALFLSGFLRESRGELALTGAAHPFAGPEEARTWLGVELAGLTAAVHQAPELGLSPFSWHLTHALRGFLYTRRLDVDFLAVGQSGLRAAEEAGSPLGQALCHMVLGFAGVERGSLDAGIAHTERALRLYEGIGHISGVVSALNNLSDMWTRRGRINLAREHADRGALLGGEVPSDLVPEPVHLATHAQLRTLSGDYDAAFGYLAQVEELSARFGVTHLTANLHQNLGLIHLFLGDPARAEGFLLTAKAAAEHAGSETDLYDCLAALVLCLTRSGQLARAEAEAAALEGLLERGVSSYSGDDWADTALLELRLATGPADEALGFGEEALRRHLAAGHELVVMRLRTRLGHARAADGALGEAVAHWQPAYVYATREDLPDRHILESLLAAYSPGRPSAR